jgi:DNA-binding transcriptional MerR regulator
MTSYRIAEAADLVGVPATTLRYYEDIGVVSRPFRDRNGYRHYSEHDIERLRFVARAKQLHLSVDDLRELAQAWDTDDCSSVQHRMAEVVATRLRDAQHQVAELTELAAQLQAVASRLQTTAASGPCGDDCPCVAPPPPQDTPTLIPMERMRPLNGDYEASPGGCTLDADAVEGRTNDWQAVLSKAVARTAVDGMVVLRLPADADTAAELARLAAAEQMCCSFVDFRLSLVGSVIEFEVRTPPEASEVAALFAAPA